MDDAGQWWCIGCGACNILVIDPDDGENYELIEDCEVCCRPHRLVVTIDRTTPGRRREVTIDADSAS